MAVDACSRLSQIRRNAISHFYVGCPVLRRRMFFPVSCIPVIGCLFSASFSPTATVPNWISAGCPSGRSKEVCNRIAGERRSARLGTDVNTPKSVHIRRLPPKAKSAEALRSVPRRQARSCFVKSRTQRSIKSPASEMRRAAILYLRVPILTHHPTSLIASPSRAFSREETPSDVSWSSFFTTPPRGGSVRSRDWARYMDGIA